MRLAERVRAACVLGSTVVIDGSPSVIFRKELFDFPIALLRSDAEFEIFLGNGVPVLDLCKRYFGARFTPLVGLPCKPS